MPLSLTGGMGSTNTRAGVNTLVSNTGSVVWTFGIDGAFGLAFHVGIAKHFRQAGTGGSSISFPAFGVNATRRGSAWVNDLRSWSGC